MKWVQTTQVLKSDGISDKDKGLFKEYKTDPELQKDLGDKSKFVKWVKYPDDDPLQKQFELDRKAQRKYEIFVGGFLHYHDIEFKRYPKGGGYEYPKDPDSHEPAKWKDYDGDRSFEHEIYFEWLPKEKGPNNKTSVKIYINPTPEKFNSDPPPPPTPPPPESNEVQQPG